jgi:hypothetical protein
MVMAFAKTMASNYVALLERRAAFGQRPLAAKRDVTRRGAAPVEA